MYTSVELLDMLKARYRLPSDYAAAKKIGVKSQFIYKIKHKQSCFGIDTALIVAELLELEPLKVIASTRIEQAERKHDDKYISMWREYAA